MELLRLDEICMTVTNVLDFVEEGGGALRSRAARLGRLKTPAGFGLASSVRPACILLRFVNFWTQEVAATHGIHDLVVLRVAWVRG
jgi:hypothetical protein